MNLREAAQQALEALEIAMKTPIDEYLPRECLEAIDALRAALSGTQDWDEVEALRESLREHMAEIHRLRAAGRQALKAMDDLHRTGDTQVFDMYGCEATEALRAALEPVTDCHEKEGDKLASPLDHIPDADKMGASVRESRTVEPVAYVTGYSKGYATVRPVDPCLLMPVGMALYRSPPTISKTETVEPVAYIHETGFLVRNPAATLTAGMKLYSAPPKRKPLTEDQLIEAYCCVNDQEWAIGGMTDARIFARAIERAHGIGGEE